MELEGGTTGHGSVCGLALGQHWTSRDETSLFGAGGVNGNCTERAGQPGSGSLLWREGDNALSLPRSHCHRWKRQNYWYTNMCTTKSDALITALLLASDRGTYQMSRDIPCIVVVLTVRSPENNPQPFKNDPQRVYQILRNTIVNAVIVSSNFTVVINLMLSRTQSQRPVMFHSGAPGP
jgi:hypothetical protein